MATILILHGFGSCSDSKKILKLKNHFTQHTIIAPDLSYSPLIAITQIENILKKTKIDMIIGSSLGGFYATYMAELYALKAILINPATQPHITLQKDVGRFKNFCTGESFDFLVSYLEDLHTISKNPLYGKYLVLLQSEDEVLDYKLAQELYQKHKVVVEFGGTHQFENIEEYFSLIEAFIR